MKHYRLSKLVVLLGMMSCSQFSHASAFQFYELGTPIVGTAGVGQAAVANDASTAYFNPAGMSALPTTEVMLGSQFILPYTNFSPNSSTTISGNNGGNAGLLAPSASGYFVYHYSPKLSVGVSVTSPYGGALSYYDHWVGRYIVQQMTFYTIDFNPAVSYQVNPWLSVGGGVVIEYANLNQTLALPISPSLDGQADIKAADFHPGFNLGVLLTPTKTTNIGVAFRSQIVHGLNGNTDFLNISATPTTNTRMVMPANVIASISQVMTEKLTLLGEVGWANWSSMHNTVLTIDGYSVVTPDNWSDTYRVGVGGKYQYTPVVALQAGVSYDSSPANTSNRLPNLPVDRQIRVGAGIGYALMKSAVLGLSYEYMNLGQANINTTSSLGTLSGSYSRNYANVFQASINVSC